MSTPFSGKGWKLAVARKAARAYLAFHDDYLRAHGRTDPRSEDEREKAVEALARWIAEHQ